MVAAAAGALVIAGAGVGVLSSSSGHADAINDPHESVQPLSADLAIDRAEHGATAQDQPFTARTRLALGGRDQLAQVSRSAGRDDLQRAELLHQAQLEARQRTAALQELARSARDRAGELRDQLRADRRAERTAEARAELRAGLRAEHRAEHRADRQAELRADQWVPPLTGYSLSAGFGEAGSLWSSGSHTGLDFSAPEGTPLVAVTSGVVSTAGYSGAADWAGNLVVIQLEDGREIWYAHQSSVAVEVGQTVEAGQVVGYVGSTGNSTGPHLHLEVQVGGEPVDPYAVLIEHGVRL